MLVRVRRSSRATQACGDAPPPACPPRNNSGAPAAGVYKTLRRHASTSKNQQPRPFSAFLSTRQSNRTTFTDYVKLRQEILKAGSGTNVLSRNASDSLIDAKLPIFQREQLTTFAEYQKRGLGAAERRQDNKQTRPSLASSDSSQMEFPEPVAMPVVMETGAATAVARSTAADETVDQNGEEDANTGDTAAQGQQGGCCGCCSRAKRKNVDATGRRKRRLVEQDGVSSLVGNPQISQLLDEEADSADVKDMDPTITLMPYVLFESERHKVLYQSVGMDEAEVLKKAIALHANDLYKQMLMRLSISRYLNLIREKVVRTVLSKKIQFFLNNDALAVNLMGIEITAEESKSTGDSDGNSPGLSVGDFTFDSQAVELSQSRSTQLIESPDVSRQMFKSAPKFSDAEVLELLNAGKILDITGRASLESLVSLPVTKVGQRRSS